LVKGERKVSFDEAWRALQFNEVRTYAVCCMKLMKGTMIRKAIATQLICFKVIKNLFFSFPSLTPIN
jgi:hypothetical protein